MNISAGIKAAKLAVTSKAGLTALRTQKHAPVLLFGAGVVGVVGTVVLASRATLHVEEKLANHDDRKAEAHISRETAPEVYTSFDLKKDLTKSQTVLVLDMVKLYAPATILGVASIGALCGSHYILTKRNAGLVAALTAVERSLSEYRARVVADQGEEKDLEYMFGSNTREEYSEGKKGQPKVEHIKHFGDGSSPYSVVFDAENLNWGTTPEINLYFLRMIQSHLNDKLQAKGHVFLNDAYRELGFPDTTAGAVCGWLRDEGDTFIDFGLWSDPEMEQVKSFHRGKQGALLLDFNVIGDIHRKIQKKD